MTEAERTEDLMTATTVTLAADGSIPVPVALLRAAGLNPGDVLVLECDGHSILVRPLDLPDAFGVPEPGRE